MAGITLSQAEDMLAESIAARSAILNSQEYSTGNKRLVRAQLDQVNKDIVYWNTQVSKLSRNGGIRITGASPCL